MIVSKYDVPGMNILDHVIEVPLNWKKPDGPETIKVFAREIVDPVLAKMDLPILLFLQGGPGGQGPRPGASGWWRTALKTHRLVLLDQRGTGRSTAVDADRISQFDNPEAAADYLSCFRADSIVADAEALRAKDFCGKRWSTLGQSYGGFITLTYLSTAPHALERCYITGGIPGTRGGRERIYFCSVNRMLRRNLDYYQQFPYDERIIGEIADRLTAGPVMMPRGDVLTIERFQTLGMSFGMSTGFDSLHWLVDTAWSSSAVPGSVDGELSQGFLGQVESLTGFDDNPLYMVMQETIYGDGNLEPGWVGRAVLGQYSQFDPRQRPLLFTGEITQPWMFDNIRALRPFRGAMEAMMMSGQWDPLYDFDKLGSNDVPVAAIAYLDDPYVDVDESLETASRITNMKVWVTNEFLHDGLRVAPEQILPRLFEMGDGRR